MKKILSLSIILLALTACNSSKEKSVADIIASENLSEIIKQKRSYNCEATNQYC